MKIKYHMCALLNVTNLKLKTVDSQVIKIYFDNR